MLNGSLTNAALGPYVLRELIGAGGVAEVYRAQHREDSNSIVAVKVMRSERQADQQHLKSFKQEFELLQQLKHAGIPKALRIGEIKGRLAMAQHYFPGTSLHLLEEAVGKFDVESVFLKLTDIVGYLHENKIVHNDLKLENVILNEDGNIALVDFGNARRASSGLIARLFRRKEPMFGTPSYFAPELIAGGSPSYASDVYALGVCCFVLLTGNPPFDETRKSQRLRAAVNDMPPSIADKVSGLTPSFSKLIDSCLAKNPDLRPADGGRLHTSLSVVARSKQGTGIYSKHREKKEG